MSTSSSSSSSNITMGSKPSSKNNVSYYVVPSLKAIVTHKIISFIYEDNLLMDLKRLDNDVLEYMTSKMPFSVIYRIYELKLASDAIGDDFLKAYAYHIYISNYLLSKN